MSEVQSAAPAATVSTEATPVETKVVDTKKVEAPKEEPKVEEPKQDDKFASKFAALNRREKAIKQREADIDKRLKDLELKNQPAQETKVPDVPFEKRLKKDFFGTLKEQGFDLDTIVNIALNEGKLPASMQEQLEREELKGSVESKIEALERKLKEKEEKEEAAKLESEKNANEKAISNFKKDIKGFVDKNKETYELISSEGMEDLVYDVITQHWEQTKDEETQLGELMEIKDAADKVEEHLLAEAKRYMEKSKIKKLVGASPTEQKLKTEEKKPESVTLSNSLTQEVPGEEVQAKSREEVLAEATKLLRWKS